MTFAPLLAAPWVIQLHTLAAVVSVLLLAPIATLRQGTALHRSLGWAWAVSMVVVCISSFGITHLGRYSWIHILSVISLVSLTLGIVHRRRGDIRTHQRYMTGAALGLVGAGMFTVLPGRIMHAVLLG